MYIFRLAQNAMSRCKAGQGQYFVLALITRGIFDDIKETVQAIIFASRAPISVIFIGVGENDLSELERLGTAGTRLNYHGRKPERDCSQVRLYLKLVLLFSVCVNTFMQRRRIQQERVDGFNC